MNNSRKLTWWALIGVLLGALAAGSQGQEKPSPASKRGVVRLDRLLRDYRREGFQESIAAIATRTDLAARRHKRELREIFLGDVSNALGWYGLRYDYESISAARLTPSEARESVILLEEHSESGLYYYSQRSDISAFVSRGMNSPALSRYAQRERPLPPVPPLPR